MRSVRTSVLILGLSLAACASQQTTWPKFHHDLLQTGASQFSTAANPGTLKWKFATGGAVRSSPAIADDGTIYVGSGDGKLYAFNPDGGGKWTFATGGAVDSSPAIAGDGTVYVGSADGNLYAIDPNGTLEWKIPLAGAVRSSPAIAAGGGVIYVGASAGYLYAVSSGGSLLWQFFFYPGVSVVRSPAVAADGTIYIGAQSPDFYALSPLGAAKWNFTHPGNPGTTSAAVAADGTIYVGSQDTKLYALDPGGSVKWSFATTSNIIGSSPAIGADGTIYIGSGDGFLYAVDSSGMLRWKLSTGTRIVDSSPAIGADGTIYVGSHDGNLYAVTANGTLKWKFATNGPIDSSPAIGSDGTIFVGSGDRNLYAIGAATAGPCPLPASQYTWTHAAGATVKYDGLMPFDFPAGGTIHMDVAAGDASCVHQAVVPFPGGFETPVFCIPALGFTVDVFQTGCGVGRIDSDGGSDFTVVEVADTSSPIVCGLKHGPPCATNPGDADLRVDITVGDGATDICNPPGRANALVVVPTQAVIWLKIAQCPDLDGMYDPGTDTLVTSFSQTLDLTTDSAFADYRDLEGDGCCIAGAGPAGAINPCQPGGMGPLTANGTCIDLSGLGVAGADVTSVVAGAASTGAPLYDVTFTMSLPSEIAVSGPPTGATCTSPPVVVFPGTGTRCLDAP